MTVTDLLLGRRLSNKEQDSRKIGWFEAVPAMGLDGLGSSSYGPEAALAIMIPMGAASANWIGPIMLPIILLLVVLYLSYRQTILAYPTNGGAYTVAKENLGRRASLLAAAALMIDYTLNVAVGISAGVGALVSSIPELEPYTLALCLGILVVITVANMRGTSEAGWLFALPTYTFLVCFLALIAVGLWRVVASGGHPVPVTPVPSPEQSVEAVGIWLLLRAFASGCTAMTGVEAVSNGVGAFKKPVIQQAHRTLTVICLMLGLLLGGIAVLAHAYGLTAMDQSQPGYRSVLSQLAGAIAGEGPFFYVAMASVLCVLCLSANTSFVGFPRLCRMVAVDGYLPRPFAISDRRLVFSVGILALTVMAGLLLIVFGGITDKLIPLFAIGAFLTFTISQIGMVVHWRKQPEGNQWRLVINAVGAVVTGLALLIILMAKFTEGAWITALMVPLTLALLVGIHRYYQRLDRSLCVSSEFQIEEIAPPTLVVLVEDRSRMTDRSLSFAMTMSPDVVAVHLLRLNGPDVEEDGRRLKDRWLREVETPLFRRGLRPPRLVLLPAPYREAHTPLLEFMEKIDADTPGREVVVLIPELVFTHWWQHLLHTHRAERLRRALLRNGGPRLNVMVTPWRR